MVSAELYDGNRVIVIKDGYLGSSNSGRGSEQGLADSFYRAALQSQAGKNDGISPENLQVAVIGNDGWTNSMSEPFRALAPEESRPDYRLLALSFELGSEQISVSKLESLIDSLGFEEDRVLHRPALFRVLASTRVLDPISDKYQSGDEKSLANYLDSCKVPFAITIEPSIQRT